MKTPTMLMLPNVATGLARETIKTAPNTTPAVAITIGNLVQAYSVPMTFFYLGWHSVQQWGHSEHHHSDGSLEFSARKKRIQALNPTDHH